MYSYFTKEQVIALANHLIAPFITTPFSETYLNDWITRNPQLFQSLPPIFSLQQHTHFVLNNNWTPAAIHAIHILPNGCKYDINLLLPNDGLPRLYNVSPSLIARPEWQQPNIGQQK